MSEIKSICLVQHTVSPSYSPTVAREWKASENIKKTSESKLKHIENEKTFYEIVLCM
jgi:hypothetical protein